MITATTDDGAVPIRIADHALGFSGRSFLITKWYNNGTFHWAKAIYEISYPYGWAYELLQCWMAWFLLLPKSGTAFQPKFLIMEL